MDTGILRAGEIDRTRDQWLGYADRLIAGARRYASLSSAQILLPGSEGGYGRAVDGLEGFTRTLLIAGFRIAGERGQGLDDLIAFCARGIAAGVDPDNVERWVRLTEHPQAKVEAASIALILDMTRPWIWDQLDEITQQRVISYLAPVVGDDRYPKNNWLWFRIVVQTFLRSVGGPWSPDDIAADLALHDSFRRADGWISDGVERAYDHYVGWALHLYPVLWSRMRGAADLAPGQIERDVLDLDRYLQDALALVGADGSPLIQGRSLIYRFAAAAPFWAGVFAEVPSSSAGLLRHAAGRIVSHFADHGVPGESEVLTLGWHGEWPALAQSYSGPGSPYWAAKGLLGIALPADHPVWSAPAEPLPVEAGDTLRAVAAPGWVIAGTQSDGIVRVVNHGTDHARAGSHTGDSPLYARIGYSTATSPLLDEESWTTPLEQSVALIDGAGRATHRTAMRLTEVTVDADGVGLVGSDWDAHWLDPEPTEHRHGSGRGGTSTVAGVLAVRSLVRGAWELRLTHIVSLDREHEVAGLRVGGWAVAGANPDIRLAVASVDVTAGQVTSSIQNLLGAGTADVSERRDASPLGPVAAVPFLDYPAVVGSWTAALVGLSGSSERDVLSAAVASVEVVDAGDVIALTVTWPDGRVTTSRLSNPRSPATVDRHQERAQ
ncbi:MAG: DUF2264 domain-containing protein [Pseudolysinimonas sp.]|uniref:DUF2264 domain-containing protein n=1 Tax=Pseudolysinimonas sp. TaxID=2680009 RepID=UPI0032643260